MTIQQLMFEFSNLMFWISNLTYTTRRFAVVRFQSFAWIFHVSWISFHFYLHRVNLITCLHRVDLIAYVKKNFFFFETNELIFSWFFFHKNCFVNQLIFEFFVINHDNFNIIFIFNMFVFTKSCAICAIVFLKFFIFISKRCILYTRKDFSFKIHKLKFIFAK